jgi:hypothetical protein
VHGNNIKKEALTMGKTNTTSQIIHGISAPVNSVLSSRTRRMYRRRGFSNLLKMGHCAPAVMQTFLDLRNSKEEWLVKMTAGLPGGIGNTGFECGGLPPAYSVGAGAWSQCKE